MTAEQIIAAAKARRSAERLHVRVTGIPNRDAFDYYAKDAAKRDDFIARARRKGYTAEIVT